MSNLKFIGLFLIVSFVMMFSVNVQAENIIRDHRVKKGDRPTLPRKPPSVNTTDHRVNNSRMPAAPVSGKYLGQYPKDRNNGWSDKLQGVGHDQNNWFFTQTKRLWKFPISHDLKKKLDYRKENKFPAGVKTMTIPESLKREGYNHLGDLVHHKGYLFIPLEAEDGKNNQKPLLAVFRASNLAFVGSARLTRQIKAGWLAINPSNDWLYTSHKELSNANQLFAYRIDFNALKNNKVWIKYQNTKTLFDESGHIINLKLFMQGGEFSDNGKYLFLVNGRASTDTPSRDGGIWVFDFKTGKKVLKSSTKGNDFKYEYHPGFPNGEEPEGITFWSLDNRNAPNIKGNLHVILLNTDQTSSDEFWLKHYRIYGIR